MTFARVFDKKSAMTFIRKIEDFVCENCGEFVSGDGYTNHCPKCLFSKHVDESPGDRKAVCKGLMEPIGFDKKDGEYKIIHKCRKCRVQKRCKVRNEDEIKNFFNF